MQRRTTASRRSRALAPSWRRREQRGRVVLWLVAGAVLIWGLLCLLGILLTHVVDTTPLHGADLGVNQWLARHRTAFWNDATAFGTAMAQTLTVVAVTAVAVVVLRLVTRRWHEGIMLVISIAGELVIFLAVTVIVPQRRPQVHRLDPAATTSSYPSGHTAASIALYGCLAILILWLVSGRPAAKAIAALLFCVPVFVAFSRVYRGMHYPSDVIAGAMLGIAWLVLVVKTLLPAPSAHRRSRGLSRPRVRRSLRPARTRPIASFAKVENGHSLVWRSSGLAVTGTLKELSWRLPPRQGRFLAVESPRAIKSPAPASRRPADPAAVRAFRCRCRQRIGGRTGSTWRPLASSRGPQAGGLAVYDTALGDLVVFRTRTNTSRPTSQWLGTSLATR
jgi:membrane-associated phospholipid phosphatase